MQTILKDFKRTAIVYKNQAISYADLLDQIAAYANVLSVEPQDRVVILSEKRPELLIALYAIWVKQAIAVPYDAEIGAKELAALLNDTQPTVIFVSRSKHELLRSSIADSHITARVVVFEDIGLQQKSLVRKPVISNKPDDVALILYTSGTTGTKKGVMLTFGNLHHAITLGGSGRWSQLRSKLKARQVKYPMILPLHHVYGLLFMAVRPLYIGASVVLLDVLATGGGLEVLKSSPVTVLMGVPRLYERLHAQLMREVRSSSKYSRFFHWSRRIGSIRFAKLLFRSLHRQLSQKPLVYMSSGGAKLSRSILLDMHALGFSVREGYGSTETTGLVCYHGERKPRYGTVGKASASVQVKIIDGEVVIKGTNVMKGYWSRDNETARVLRDGWFFTGDKGSLDKDGYLTIEGRMEDIIVLTNGENINPHAIETRLLGFGTRWIDELAVCEKNGAMIAIIKTFDKHIDGDPHTFIENHVIIPYNQEASQRDQFFGFLLVTSPLPRTRTGKLQRNMLTEFANNAVRRSYLPPLSPIETELASICEDALNIGRIGVTERLFDLGLDSLAFAQILSMIKARMGKDLSTQQFQAHDSIRELASFLEGPDFSNDARWLALEQEALLDPDIAPQGDILNPAEHPEEILLTGATGYVGIFLLKELMMQTDATIHCLVRGKSTLQAYERLKHRLEESELWEHSFAKRIKVVLGDLEKPGLGLKGDEFARLSEIIDVIYHNATRMNHAEDYDAQKVVNKNGLQAILRLAITRKLKPVHYSSTLGVFTSDADTPLKTDEFSPIDSQKHNSLNGYFSAKWVAEGIVEQAIACGIPCRIYRLGLISGDVEKGRLDARQYPYQVLEASVKTGTCFNDFSREIQLTPIDFAAKSIVYLSLQKHQHHVSHVVSPHKISFETMFKTYNELNPDRRLIPLPYFDWLRTVDTYKDDDGAKLPLAALTGKSMAASRSQLEAALAMRRTSMVDSTTTYNQLKEVGIIAPEINREIIQKYFNNI